MRKYLIKSSWMLQKLYPKRWWNIPAVNKKTVYITFDDGPNPTTTPFILDTLHQYNVKATFFCIGKNVESFPHLYKSILEQGHQVGNHTQNHLNGWNTATNLYIENIETAAQHIDSHLFRPPYGRMTKAQEKAFQLRFPEMKIVMWDIITGDFDTEISPEKCWNQFKNKISTGSIIVFHDSDKAAIRMQYALPKLLEQLKIEGFQCELLP